MMNTIQRPGNRFTLDKGKVRQKLELEEEVQDVH